MSVTAGPLAEANQAYLGVIASKLKCMQFHAAGLWFLFGEQDLRLRFGVALCSEKGVWQTLQP